MNYLKITISFLILPFFIYAQTGLNEVHIIPQRRLALVIGMNDYANVRPLKNPINDADDIQKSLKGLNFDVTVAENFTYEQLNLTINNFIESIKINDIVLVYYSGHGFEYSDNNYILPVDANIETLEKVFSMNKIAKSIKQKNIANCYVILDCDRNLPFGKKDDNTSTVLNTENKPTGCVFIYATQLFGMALETHNRNGLFTQELIKKLDIPNLSVSEIVNKTAKAVIERNYSSGSYQEPTLYGSLGTELILNSKKESQINNINSLELSYDLSENTPTVPNQGATPNVVYWATLYNAYGTQLAKRLNLKTKIEIDAICLSPAFAKKMDKQNCKEGSSLTSPALISMKEGSVLFKDYQDFDCESPIPASILTKRNKNFVIEDYIAVFNEYNTKNEKVFYSKKYISMLNTPVIVSLPFYEGFENLTKDNYYYKPIKNKVTGYHAAVIIGYDFRKGFKLINTWGKSWGQNGFFWIDFATFGEFVESGIALSIGKNGVISAER